MKKIGDKGYLFGSDSLLVQLRLFCADQSGLKQIDFPAAVHLPSDEFEAGDLPLVSKGLNPRVPLRSLPRRNQ